MIEEIRAAGAPPGAAGEDLRSRYRHVISARVRTGRPQRQTLTALLSAVLADAELTEYVYRHLIRPGVAKAGNAVCRPESRPGWSARWTCRWWPAWCNAISLGIDLLAQMGDTQMQALLAAGDRLADAFTGLLLDGLAAPASED